MTDIMHHKEQVRHKKVKIFNELYLHFLTTFSPCSLISGMVSGVKER